MCTFAVTVLAPHQQSVKLRLKMASAHVRNLSTPFVASNHRKQPNARAAMTRPTGVEALFARRRRAGAHRSGATVPRIPAAARAQKSTGVRARHLRTSLSVLGAAHAAVAMASIPSLRLHQADAAVPSRRDMLITRGPGVASARVTMVLAAASAMHRLDEQERPAVVVLPLCFSHSTPNGGQHARAPQPTAAVARCWLRRANALWLGCD